MTFSFFLGQSIKYFLNDEKQSQNIHTVENLDIQFVENLVKVWDVEADDVYQ